MNPPHRRKVIRRQEDVDARRRVIIAFLAVLIAATVATVAVAFFAAENRKRANEGRQAHDFACLIKANLALRVARTDRFLKSNPDPVIFGLNRVEIERNLEEDRATLDAANRTGTCDPPPRASRIPTVPPLPTTIGEPNVP